MEVSGRGWCPPALRRRWIITDTPTLSAAPQDIGAARQFAIDAARLLANTRCHNVAVLDVTGISPVTDFLVLATGTSPRQMKTAADDLEELGGPRDFQALSRAGDDTGTWICVDFVDLVVHVFNAEARLYYDLDNLWGDAKKVEWRDPEAADAAADDAGNRNLTIHDAGDGGRT